MAGSIDEQVKLFYNAFPKIENNLFDNNNLMNDFGFFDEFFPAEAFWIKEDGSFL